MIDSHTQNSYTYRVKENGGGECTFTKHQIATWRFQIQSSNKRLMSAGCISKIEAGYIALWEPLYLSQKCLCEVELEIFILGITPRIKSTLLPESFCGQYYMFPCIIDSAFRVGWRNTFCDVYSQFWNFMLSAEWSSVLFFCLAQTIDMQEM